MPNIGPLELVILIGIVVGAIAGWRIWSTKGQEPWRGAVFGGLLGVLVVIGWLILFVIDRTWRPAQRGLP
jgi:hypothetical protein